MLHQALEKLPQESTFTEDWNEANKRLRERLQARDGNILEVVRKGENLTFGEWVELFLENYSKPPIREPKTHVANLRAANHLKNAFATRPLVDVTADGIEHYLRNRLRQRVRFKTSKTKSSSLGTETFYFPAMKRQPNISSP
jgi:hypothetical protein